MVENLASANPILRRGRGGEVVGEGEGDGRINQSIKGRKGRERARKCPSSSWIWWPFLTGIRWEPKIPSSPLKTARAERVQFKPAAVLLVSELELVETESDLQKQQSPCIHLGCSDNRPGWVGTGRGTDREGSPGFFCSSTSHPLATGSEASISGCHGGAESEPPQRAAVSLKESGEDS